MLHNWNTEWGGDWWVYGKKLGENGNAKNFNLSSFGYLFVAATYYGLTVASLT